MEIYRQFGINKNLKGLFMRSMPTIKKAARAAFGIAKSLQ
jgi:hypothetical protein